MSTSSKEAKEIIRTLETGDFYIQCPCCDEPFPLRKAGLFYLDEFTPDAKELYQQYKQELKERERELKGQRKSITQKSQVGAKAVNIGFILERLAPTMPGFRFDRNDCRSLFDPIDYVIFEGLSKKGVVSKILLSDIKTGAAKLSNKQKEIKVLVEKKKIGWDTYMPEGGK
jgi:predicted Holliday junction resolvase-like endonuclease